MTAPGDEAHGVPDDAVPDQASGRVPDEASGRVPDEVRRVPDGVPGRTPDEVRGEVAARLARVVLRVTRRIRPTREGLSASHFSLLATLLRYGPRRPSDLAHIERLAPPAVSRVVGALEERGFVVRRPSPDDARSHLVEITDAGAALVLEARAEQADAVARLLEALDEDQLAALAAALGPLEQVAREASLGDLPAGVTPAEQASPPAEPGVARR